jgi:FMN phosphatase YigB (HAD superfamily)
VGFRKLPAIWASALMALTLAQYIDYLDSRGTTWPAPPKVEPTDLEPRLYRLPDIRAVTWNVYGTLLAISGGTLLFEHPQQVITDLALDKTIQEFKMWAAMTRKPGQPTEYFGPLYAMQLHQMKGASGGGERFPEVAVDALWEALVKKLLKKDYKFDTGFYGSLNEFSRKVAYFFHASLQGVGCYPGAGAALSLVKSRRLVQGLLGDGQCFTLDHLKRCLRLEDAEANVADAFDPELRVLSYSVKARPPSERPFREVLGTLARRGIRPEQVLHIGSRLTADVAPARRLRMRTALFAGDKGSLDAAPDQLERSQTRPDVILTELGQITEVVG